MTTVADSKIESQTQTWKMAAFFAAIVFCLSFQAFPDLAQACGIGQASPALALACGVVLALTVGNPYARRGARIAKLLLQVSVVMLGFRMELQTILRAGAEGALYATSSIGATLLLGYIVGRWLSIDTKTSALISTGTAICGGSAIAAVSSVLAVGEGEVTVALGTVFILNGIALYLFPMLGHALHLNQEQFGTWAGIAIHDISSVAGASSSYGGSALETAMAVKLFRSLWIAPVTLGFAYIWSWRSKVDDSKMTLPADKSETSKSSRPKIQVPWFIGLFLLASLAHSFVPGVKEVSPAISKVAMIGLTLTLFLIGAGLSMKTLRAVGWKALLQGVLLWFFISVGSLLVIVMS